MKAFQSILGLEIISHTTKCIELIQSVPDESISVKTGLGNHLACDEMHWTDSICTRWKHFSQYWAWKSFRIRSNALNWFDLDQMKAFQSILGLEIISHTTKCIELIQSVPDESISVKTGLGNHLACDKMHWTDSICTRWKHFSQNWAWKSFRMRLNAFNWFIMDQMKAFQSKLGLEIIFLTK
jgi:hypothetical protein